MDLERIAREYHLKPQEDMFIENICQEYELTWVKKLIPRESKVLELGYGDGVTFRELSRHCNLAVVEGSKLIFDQARNVAREMHSNARIFQSFFEEFSPQEKYDFVFASHVLEHVMDPTAVVKKMAEWLAPNGKAIVIVPNSMSLHRRLAVLMGIQPTLETLSPRDHLVGHVRVYNTTSLVEEFNSSIWKVETLRGFFLKPLANSQMTDYDVNLVEAMCAVSDDIPADICANIALVVSLQENSLEID